nr:IS66 family insertion sequence element accessory protein TnpB [uncultured Noviherbaspirillum sp.]
MIRIIAIWLAVAPLDMRAGLDTALARVVTVFGSAQPHHAYFFANRREESMKVLVHDGIGIWLASRRLHQGRFTWPSGTGTTVALSQAKLDALVVGLLWRHLGQVGIITVI